MIEPVESLDPFVDQVYRGLRRAISLGELPPGQRIPQAGVAASFGVSRQPVSHALHLLKQQGLIEAWGKKGFAVSEVQIDQIRELYEIRGALDGLAARLAAERVRSGALPSAGLHKAREVLDEASRLATDAPIARILELELAFHREIYALSGNRAIERTLDQLWPHLLRAMALIHTRRKATRDAQSEHNDLLSAIAGGAPALAESRALLHTQRASLEIAEHLETRAGDGRLTDVA